MRKLAVFLLLTLAAGADAEIAGPLGVPKRLRNRLKIDVSPQRAAGILGQPAWPETSQGPLKPEWLAGKSAWERMLMRNVQMLLP